MTPTAKLDHRLALTLPEAVARTTSAPTRGSAGPPGAAGRSAKLPVRHRDATQTTSGDLRIAVFVFFRYFGRKPDKI
jgi:hypothetical protein